jgi:hypothetical protein
VGNIWCATRGSFLIVVQSGRLRDGTGRSDVMEYNGSGHGGGHPLGKFANLRVNISEPGVTAPPPEFLDECRVHVVEVEGHGPGSADRVGANSRGGETPVVKVCAAHRDQ